MPGGIARGVGVLWAAALLGSGCSEAPGRISGRLLADADGPWTGQALVEVVDWEVWTGRAVNDADAFQADQIVDDGTFSVTDVPPGTYAVLATAGTCTSSPPEQVELAAGESVTIDLVLTCAE